MHSMVLSLLMVTTAASGANPPERLQVTLPDGCALRVQIRRDERPACWTLHCAGQPERELGCDATAMHQVSDLSVSPDGRLLAVTSVGEGHPILEIIAATPFIVRGRYRPRCQINPFPGTVVFKSWGDDGLLVESDVNLLETSAEQRVMEMDSSMRTFAVSTDDCSVRQ